MRRKNTAVKKSLKFFFFEMELKYENSNGSDFSTSKLPLLNFS